MPKLTHAELLILVRRGFRTRDFRTPCRATHEFSAILDRPVTCNDVIDAMARLRTATYANQGLRNPPIRSAD